MTPPVSRRPFLEGEGRRLRNYGVAGALSTLAFALGYHILVYVGMSAQLAYAAGFALSLLVTFLVNAKYTFRARHHDVAQVTRFLAVVFGNFIFCEALIYGLVDHLGISPLAAFWVLLPIVPIWNYVGMRQWVFRDALGA